MKYKLSVVLMITLLVCSVFSQVQLTGKVLDKDNSPVSGVVAELESLGLMDTTGSDGVYFLGTTGIENSNAIFSSGIVVKGRKILFPVYGKQRVSINMFTLNGRIIRVFNKNLNDGYYSISPSTLGIANQILTVRINVGNLKCTKKIVSIMEEKEISLSKISSIDNGTSVARSMQVDTLSLSKDGQCISRRKILSLVDTLPDILTAQINIVGKFSNIPDSISRVEGVFTGGDIEGSFIKTLGYAGGNYYSGYIYSLSDAVAVKNYAVYIKVYDELGRFIGKSIEKPFNNSFGVVQVDSFDVENAKPMVSLGNDTTVSIYDTLKITAIVSDQFRGRSNIKYKWNINGAGFIDGSEDTAIVAPDSVNRSQIKIGIMVIDSSGNEASDEKIITVIQDIPKAVASIVAIEPAWSGDSITLKGGAFDSYGYIKKWEWDFGNGFVETSLSDTGILISNIGNNMFVLRVTDDDNNIDLDTVNINALGMNGGMSFIPSQGIIFDMGMTLANYHKVSFTYNFYMDTVEVTQADYEALMGVNPSESYNINRPVDNVDWLDAVLYCNLKSKRDGYDTVYSYTAVEGASGDSTHNLTGLSIDITKNGYRLPTEAEWEFAYYGKVDHHSQEYYWGNIFNEDYLWYKDNSNDSSHIVGTKLPNGFRLYDMAGNVVEWVNDWWEEEYTTTGEITVDPTGPVVGEWGKCARGASFMADGDHDYHSGWFRWQWGAPVHYVWRDTGFRTVRTAE